ncbi:MAG: phosphoglycerate mutase family protein [Pseudobdellovibrionaceae bacterium]
MRIILMRHGQSEGNINPEAYVDKGESISLTSLGWDQTERASEFLKDLYEKTETPKWPTIYVGPYVRHEESLRGVLSSLPPYFGCEPNIKQDARLIEQYFGATAAIKTGAFKGIKGWFGKLYMEFAEALYRRDPFVARTPFGDNPFQMLINTKSFIDGTFVRDIEEGQDDFLIVSSGAAIKGFVFNWFHLPIEAWKEVKTPGNADIFMIAGERKNWKFRQIYDGEKGDPIDINPIEHIRRLTYADLPQRPLT